MQIDLVPGIPPSGCFEKSVPPLNVFSRYLVAYATTNQDAQTIAKVIFNNVTKLAYLPTTVISDKGSAFMSHVIKEVAGVLGITLKHATTKHKARTNNWQAWAVSCVNQTSFEDWNRWAKIIVA